MALRTLDNEEIDYLYKQIQELNVLHGKATGENALAYSTLWNSLSAKLKDAIELYKYILDQQEYYRETVHKENAG